jgi:hypothetical protein
MSQIHYLQRHPSVENIFAYNFLELIARICEHSWAEASRLLTDLTGEPIEIGFEISQFPGGESPVPDGSINQRSFKILVDAKADSGVSPDQLLRHAGSFGNETQKLLLLLTKDPIGYREGVIAGLIRASHPDVVFRSITFGAVCDALDDLFRERDIATAALADGYREQCDELNLFEESRPLLRVVPCGRNLWIYKKFGIYFQPSDRDYSPRGLVGLYADRKVQAILDVQSVFDVDLVQGRLTKRLHRGEGTDRFDASIRQIIEEARVSCGCEIATGTRFFCGEAFETDFRKSSPGGVLRAVFVNLCRPVGSFTDAGDVASKLTGLEWQ